MASPAYRTARHTDATLEVSRWAAYLYATRRDSSMQLQSAAAQVTTAFQARATQARNQGAENRRMAQLADCLGREVYGQLYEGCQPMEKPAAGTEWVQQAHSVLQGMADYDALRAQVHGDPDLAALATAKLLQGVAQGLPAMLDEEKRQQQAQAQQQLGGRRRQRGPQADPQAAMRRAMRQAVQQAQQAAAVARAGMDGLQPGLGAPPPVHDQEGTSRMQLAEKLDGDPRLRRVMLMAGRLKRLAVANKRERDPHGSSCVVGVETGGDLQRALPAELAAMRPGSRLRRITLARWADKRLQQYQMVGESPQGRGPVVVLLDKSSSMYGMRDMWASAVALACMGVAVKEQRACTVIGFNGGLCYCLRLDTQGVAWQHPVGRGGLDLQAAPVKFGGCADMALHVASHTPFGGTSFLPPFKAALDLEDGLLRERSDLVLVTDGQANLPEAIMQRLDESKENGLRVFGLTIGGGSLGHAVRQLCDSAVDLDRAIRDDDGAEVAGAIP